MNILEVVGKWIKTARKNRGLSQEALGEKAGLSSNYISLIECGQKQVTIVTLARIVEVFGIDLADVFENYKFEEKKPQLEKELVVLMELAKTLRPEEIKAVRKVLELLLKKHIEKKR